MPQDVRSEEARAQEARAQDAHPQDAPARDAVPDETVRMDVGPSRRPPVEPLAARAPERAIDDTRPVGREWMYAPTDPAPEPEPEATVPPDAAAGAGPEAGQPAARENTAVDGPADPPAAEQATARAPVVEQTIEQAPAVEDPTIEVPREQTATSDLSSSVAPLAAADLAPTADTGIAQRDTTPVSAEVPSPAAAPSVTPGGPRSDGPGGGGPRGHGPGGEGPSGPGGDGPAGSGSAQPRRPWWRRPAVLAPVAAVAVLGGAYGTDLLVAGGDIPRHTTVAGVDIGGLSPSAAARELTSQLTPRLTATRTVVAADVRAPLSAAAAGIGLDVDATVAAADRQPLNPWTRLMSFFEDRPVRPALTTDATALDGALDALGEQVDRAPVEATIHLEGTTPSVVQPEDGRKLDRAGAGDALRAAATSADTKAPVTLPVRTDPVHVQTAAAQRVLDETVTPGLAASVTVVSADGKTSAEVPPSAIAAALTFTPKDDGTLSVGIDPAALEAALGDRLHAFGTPAKDARFEVAGGSIRVVPSVDGSGVDPAKLAEQLLPVLPTPAPRSVTAELGPRPAAFTTEQAQALGIKEQISSFTTHFSNTASGTNIRVVAAKVNGAIVKPGETFSLNGFTGPRGTAQGYVPAGVISGGEFTTAVGGGISQFATTMFNAVFFSGAQDVYHKPHSYYISRYPAGREATVYDGLIDLKWKNDGPTGIYVQTAWTPGSITVTFWGTKRYDIDSVNGQRTDVVQPVVQEKADGGTCKPQAGQEGFRITVTRVFKELGTGRVLKREDFHTRYAAEPVIHCVAPTPGAPVQSD